MIECVLTNTLSKVMVKYYKFGNSIPIKKAFSIEQSFISDFLPNYNGDLSKGRKIKNINLLPRELLGLIVASVPINIASKEPYTIGQESYLGFDGLIVRQDVSYQSHGTRAGIFFEQVYVIPGECNTFKSRLTESISKKVSNGKQYSDNVNLIILTEETTSPIRFDRIISKLKYELIIHINVLDPKPFHFDFFIIRNTEKKDEFTSAKVYIDKLSGIQQAVINNENYIVVNGQASKTNLSLPIKWS